MAVGPDLSKCKKILKAIVHACERSAAWCVAIVGMIFFVPVFVAEALIRLVKGRPPEESDTEEIMVPIRKMRTRTIDLAKVEETFPERRFDDLLRNPANCTTPPLTSQPSIAASKSDDPIPPECAAHPGRSPSTEHFEPDKTCSVCLVDFNGSDKVRQLTCQHIFHQECIDEWFTNYHSFCPLCQLDYYEPSKPQIFDRSEVSELVMTPLTVKRPRKRQFWLETHLTHK